MSDNWVVQNLENALEVWNGKLSEIWQLITHSPQDFKGGAIWAVIEDIHGALQAIGYALLVLFFVVGVVKTCGSFVEVKKPEHALKLFVRFVLAKALITYGMELMLALLDIIQGVVSSIMNATGFGCLLYTSMPSLRKKSLMFVSTTAAMNGKAWIYFPLSMRAQPAGQWRRKAYAPKRASSTAGSRQPMPLSGTLRRKSLSCLIGLPKQKRSLPSRRHPTLFLC